VTLALMKSSIAAAHLLRSWFAGLILSWIQWVERLWNARGEFCGREAFSLASPAVRQCRAGRSEFPSTAAIRPAGLCRDKRSRANGSSIRTPTIRWHGLKCSDRIRRAPLASNMPCSSVIQDPSRGDGKTWQLPAQPSDPGHQIEMPVLADKRKRVLPAEGCDPKVVAGNRLSFLAQLEADGGVVMGGFLGYV